jgi:tyrosine-protein kinase Etk/Wzc
MPRTEEVILNDENAVVPATGPDRITLGSLLDLFLREIRIIVAITACAAVFAAIFSFLLPHSYTATTTLMPPQQNRSIASALLSQLGPASALVAADAGAKDPNDVFIAILQSRSIADALVERYDLKSVYGKKQPEDLRARLAENTHIRTGKGGVINVAVEDRAPVRAAQIANSYVSELYLLNSRMAVTEAEQRRVFFEQQYKQAEQELARAQEEFRKTQQATGIIQLDAQAKGLVEGTAALQAKLASKEVEVKAMQTYATDQNPNLRVAQEELAALRMQVAKIDTHQRSGTMDVPSSNLPVAAMEYLSKLRNLKYREGVLESIAKQYEIARLDEAKNAPFLQVIDPAIPPTKPSGPNRLAIVVASTISAFVLVIAWVALREYRPSLLDRMARTRLTGSSGW